MYCDMKQFFAPAGHPPIEFDFVSGAKAIKGPSGAFGAKGAAITAMGWSPAAPPGKFCRDVCPTLITNMIGTLLDFGE
jgi:hypothetical protein